MSWMLIKLSCHSGQNKTTDLPLFPSTVPNSKKMVFLRWNLFYKILARVWPTSGPRTVLLNICNPARELFYWTPGRRTVLLNTCIIIRPAGRFWDVIIMCVMCVIICDYLQQYQSSRMSPGMRQIEENSPNFSKNFVCGNQRNLQWKSMGNLKRRF